MRKLLLLFSLLLIPFILLVQSLTPDRQPSVPLQAAGEVGSSFLAVVIAPEPPIVPVPALLNGSFEDGWTDVTDRVQLPNKWALYRIPVGDQLFDSTSPDDQATGTCECKHLLNRQLPASQQFGGPDALILDELTNYKLFGSYEKWGSEMSQTVTGLPPGSRWRLTVPIRVHLHKDPGEWAAESSVWVNGTGYWANGFQMGDQNWCKHEQVFVVPADGTAEIAIRIKSKWALPKDFFIDDIVLQSETEPAPHQNMDMCRDKPVLSKYQPANARNERRTRMGRITSPFALS